MQPFQPEHNTFGAGPADRPHRFPFVDVARGLAVVFMVQGHVLSVLLAPKYTESIGYSLWLYLRGLTAPMFFLLSGFSFAVATVRRWERFQTFSPAFFRRLAKFAFLILLGYGMHFPVHELEGLRQLGQVGWRGFLQVDVLQLVGVMLLCLQLLVICVRTPRRFAWACFGCSLTVVLLTPIVWTAPWTQRFPLILASYLSGTSGSWFPLFPWAAYVLFGCAFGYFYLWWGAAHTSLFARRLLLIGGLVLILAGLLLDKIPFSPYGAIDFWSTSPNLFLVRIGSVLAILGVILLLCSRMTSAPAPIRALSEESLSIYFVHICMLYGSIWNVGLLQEIGPHLNPLMTAAWALLLVLTMTLLAWGWNQIKYTMRPVNYVARAALALALIYPLL